LENLSVYHIAKLLFRTPSWTGQFRSSISALLETQRSVRRLLEANVLVEFAADDYIGFSKTCYRPTNVLEKLCHLDL